ncbi:hypothetical protein T484DRAFT_1808938 [Baffinella frigidus]|nr:hypothetical protein T484DRAFT_1808938 [Cryptophyta sp. CCMP2293]
MVATSMKSCGRSSSTGKKELGRDQDRVRSWSPPSLKAGRDPRVRLQNSMFKRCSSPSSPLAWEAGGLPGGQYQQQQFQHQQPDNCHLWGGSAATVFVSAAEAEAAAEAAAKLHFYQQQHQQSCAARRGRSMPSLEFNPDQGMSPTEECSSSSSARRGHTLPSLEFYPDQEMSATEELAPGIEAWRGEEGGEEGGDAAERELWAWGGQDIEGISNDT